MAANMNLNISFLFLMQLGFVAMAPVHKVITNHCDGQDCETNIQYHDGNRDLSLHTNSTNSVLSANLGIIISHDGNSDQNDLVIIMENVIAMLSSMVQAQQDNQQELDNLFQQFDIESQPTPTPGLLDFFQTSSRPEPEITTHSHLGITTNFDTEPESEITTRSNLGITTNFDTVTAQQPAVTTTVTPMEDCSTAPSSGQYNISPLNNGTNPFSVICDMDTTSGGWIVIQRRFDGSVDFDRNWVDYENGFGSLDGEFWLGLNKMHTITSDGTWKLRFDLEDFNGHRVYAEYGSFQVGDIDSNYQLTISSYSGNAGDGMTGGHDLNGMAFSTKDRDNDNFDDVNCAVYQSSGWWHNGCTQSVVNGIYHERGVMDGSGMTWYYWKHSYEVIKKTEMKIKRVYRLNP